jgi:succinate dehydrogenase flavin-adding protein (antitoxin of CptAB toxin-antitoxin module)
MDEARIKRLRWRTRRGTRELDALFGGWLDERFASARAKPSMNSSTCRTLTSGTG